MSDLEAELDKYYKTGSAYGNVKLFADAARLVANPPNDSTIRSYFVANLMDGDDGGVMTISMKQLADEATEIVGFILEDWLAAAFTPQGGTE